MKTVEQHTAEFETFYAETFNIRFGARGRASNHLAKHDGVYISDHAALCWLVWFNSASVNDK